MRVESPANLSPVSGGLSCLCWMIAANWSWSDWTSPQHIFAAYFAVGVVVCAVIQWRLMPRVKRGLDGRPQWDFKRGQSLYWVLTFMDVHPIAMIVGIVLWPIWLAVVLLYRLLG